MWGTGNQPHPWYERPSKCTKCDNMFWWPIANKPTDSPILCIDCLANLYAPQGK